MKKLILLLFTLIIFSCNNSGASLKDAIPLQKEKVVMETIPFVMVNNLPIIEAELNGINAKFLIDSGASISALDLNSMYIYGFSINENKPIELVNGVGGSQSLYYMKNARFDSCIKDSIEVVFRGMDLRRFREDYGILGILGSDYLESHEFLIDYNNKVIKRNNDKHKEL